MTRLFITILSLKTHSILSWTACISIKLKQDTHNLYDTFNFLFYLHTKIESSLRFGRAKGQTVSNLKWDHASGLTTMFKLYHRPTNNCIHNLITQRFISSDLYQVISNFPQIKVVHKKVTAHSTAQWKKRKIWCEKEKHAHKRSTLFFLDIIVLRGMPLPCIHCVDKKFS